MCLSRPLWGSPGHQHKPFSWAPPTSPPTETSFPKPPSLIQHLRSCPHAVSPSSPPILLVLSPCGFQPHHSSKAALTNRPKLPLCCQTQWPLFCLIYLNSRWPAALSATSSFLRQSTVCTSQRPHSPLSSQAAGCPFPPPRLLLLTPTSGWARLSIYAQVSTPAQRPLANPITLHWAVPFTGFTIRHYK